MTSRAVRAAVLSLGLAAGTAHAAAPDPVALAKALGARPAAWRFNLSPSGSKIVYLAPSGTSGTAVVVGDIATGTTKQITAGDAEVRPTGCVWKTETRLICTLYGNLPSGGKTTNFTRVIALNADGTKPKLIGSTASDRTLSMLQYGGGVVDMLPDDPDNVLMQVDFGESYAGGTNIKQPDPGASIQRVNVNTAVMTPVEPGRLHVEELGSDDHGAIRFKMMSNPGVADAGYSGHVVTYWYRNKNSRDWNPAGSADFNKTQFLSYDGFSEDGNALLALKPYDGRIALFRIDVESGAQQTETLLFADKHVDVDGVVRIGKFRRPVAAAYTVEGSEMHFFDPALAKLTHALEKALPGNPTVSVYDESWDGTKKLVYAESDSDPGRYYLLDTTTHKLGEIMPRRPQLNGMTLGRVEAIKYPAADGTMIPAYLTFPPGAGDHPKNLPLIVMPHGGPSARDTSGFDWLAQYFAQLGYLVVQPNFRGSAGYGAAWFAENGFKSWPLAIGDVNAGARWLAAQGIADPARTAIFGWSYGGYAALQANVLDPGLYKAAIAVAPVTDLALLRENHRFYTNYLNVVAMVGEGPHIAAGSPAQHADAFKVPVLIFQGDRDLNVDISQARLMDGALAKAGKKHELVIYKGLDHQLDDSAVRADLLSRSAALLAQTMGAPQ